MELRDLRSFNYLSEKDSKLAVQVESVYDAVKETLNAISGQYNNYTMHDVGHSLRVAAYMEDLSCGIENFEERLSQFNAFEIALMLLSSLLHDIGMFIRPEDRDNIKKNQIAYTNSLTFDGVLSVVGGSEDEAIKEIVRLTHAQRIQEYMDFDFNGNTISKILQLDGKYSFADDIVSICVAHGETYDYLNGLRNQCTKGNYTYNLQYIAALLRIADYLDLDKQRTPILWYKMMRIEGFSREEWEKHFVVYNERKFKKYIGNKYQIYFDGKSSNAKIHRKYLAYVDELRAELERADELLNRENASTKYLLNVSTKVDDLVATEGFQYSDLRLTLDYSSITELLMGNNIYGNRRLGLRELVQNSIDACKLMKEIQEGLDENEYTPQISILISKEKGYVKIKDTGIGMTIDVVKKHFLNVGKSFYKSNEFKYENYRYNPIGQFGIGFLACFLLSDNVTVKTKFYNSNEIYQIELEKNSEYVVTNTEETGSFCGTEITLDYNKFFEVFDSTLEVKKFVEDYFYTEIPIIIKDVDIKQEIARNISNVSDLLAQIDVDSTGEKYTDIICAEYSSEIEGIIRVREAKQKTNFVSKMLEGFSVYIFDDDEKKLVPTQNLSTISDGVCRMVDYTQIEAEQYASIANSRRKPKSKREALLAIDSNIKLLFLNGEEISYQCDGDDNFQITINNTPIKEIMINSELDYYEEMLDEYEYYSRVFIHNGSYVELQMSRLDCDHFWRSGSNVENFKFFNKDIWVKSFYGFVLLFPIHFKLSAVLNYKAQDIRLDVSRNNIISNEVGVQKKTEVVFLKFMLDKETDQEKKDLISAMISWVENSEN